MVPPLAKALRARGPAVHQVEVAVLHAPAPQCATCSASVGWLGTDDLGRSGAHLIVHGEVEDIGLPLSRCTHTGRFLICSVAGCKLATRRQVCASGLRSCYTASRSARTRLDAREVAACPVTCPADLVRLGEGREGHVDKVFGHVHGPARAASPSQPAGRTKRRDPSCDSIVMRTPSRSRLRQPSRA